MCGETKCVWPDKVSYAISVMLLERRVMKHCLHCSREIAMYHSAISEEVGHGHEECLGKVVVSAREPRANVLVGKYFSMFILLLPT